MKKTLLLLTLSLLTLWQTATAQERRPIDSQHPLWFIHVDVWYKADPQKIIDLIPDNVKPYVCLNLSLSCGYDTDRNVYKMPQYAFQTYKSWATVCQKNGMFFTCQPASGGHTHIQDYDLPTFEYFFKKFPNFLGWNYAEQFWGFDEPGDKSSATQSSRWALFAKLVEMSHKYGGLLTVSFCGNIWSHALNPIGEMKRNSDFLEACRKYPEAILFLYKYTTSSCFYNNESVSYGPYIAGLANNYGVRYDNCGWNGAMDALFGENSGKKYPAAAGIGTVMEQSCVNGGAVWDGPELTWREECFHELNQTTVDGYKRRQWGRFPIMDGVWIDMFRRIISGQMYIPTREEVLAKTKIVVINDVSSGNDEQKYATWNTLYDGLYKLSDPMNRNDGYFMDNFLYLKSTGRYGTIPMVIGLYDDAAKSIPVQVKKSAYTSRWSTQAQKTTDFNQQYPKVSTGDLFVNRYRNQLVTYNPHSYLNGKKRAEATIPLQYNTCSELELKYDLLSAAVIREFNDKLVFYMNNYRTDSTAFRTDTVIVRGVTSEPTHQLVKHASAQDALNITVAADYDAQTQTAKYIVKHCGALDLTINCSGSADRSAATDAIEIAKLPTPKQPEPWRGEILIEAEDMDFKDISDCCTDPYGRYPSVIGHSGNGFMNMGTNSSGALRHQLSLTDMQAGDYVISVRYNCTAKTTTLGMNVNGGSRKYARCEQTAQNEWRWATIEATLKEGVNELVITNANGVNMYIDQVSYRPKDVAPMTYYVNVSQADHGSLTPDHSEAAEGDTIRLAVSSDEGFALKEIRVINSVFYTLEKTIAINGTDEVTFVMPNDNVTLLPVFADASSVYKMDMETVLAGTLPEGWRCTQENGEVHEYPNSYTLGTRTMAGFKGWQGKALYWRNSNAEYGRQTAYPLTLTPGEYKLSYAMAAWKGSPTYKVQVLRRDNGSAVASSPNILATMNAAGNTSADLSAANERELSFTVGEEGNYVISFTDQTTTGGYHEFLLLSCRLNKTVSTGIQLTNADGSCTVSVYDLSGRRQTQLHRGLNIVRQSDGSVRKVMGR